MSKKASIYTLVVLCTLFVCVCVCVCFCVSASQGGHLEKLFLERGYCDTVVRDLCPVKHSVAPSLWQFDQ